MTFVSAAARSSGTAAPVTPSMSLRPIWAGAGACSQDSTDRVISQSRKRPCAPPRRYHTRSIASVPTAPATRPLAALPNTLNASAAGHRRQDHDRVRLRHSGVEPIEDPDVLVVEIDVDVAVELALAREELALGRRVLLGEGAKHLADVAARRLDLLLAAHGGAEDRRDLDVRHIRLTLPSRGAERLVVREDAHLLVGDVLGRPRADRAVRVAADLELGERRPEGLVEQEAADERLAGADDELDDLGRLQQAHRARQD